MREYMLTIRQAGGSWFELHLESWIGSGDDAVCRKMVVSVDEVAPIRKVLERLDDWLAELGADAIGRQLHLFVSDSYCAFDDLGQRES